MNLKTELLNHQQIAVDKLIGSRIGALFMEMGTGKSRTAIEMVYRRLNRIDKVIWFCPVGLKSTVVHEIMKHTDCNDSDIVVFDDKTDSDNLAKALWYVVGIESMSSSVRVVSVVRDLVGYNTFVILDESSYIKGHKSKRTLRITHLCEKAKYRLVLTGTPLSQGVVDLYSQMKFLSPKILGYNSFYSFAANHLEYSDKYPGMIIRAHNLEYLAAKMNPYVYQVTKKECLDLPSKIYETRYFYMTVEQRFYYDLAKDMIFDKIERYEHLTSILIFKLFSVLQGIVCGFWNNSHDGDIEIRNERLDTLMNVISEIPENEKVIIWCKYRYDIDKIKKKLGDSATEFHGGIKQKDRAKEIDRFRNDARFLIATQSCGGHGLTLNEASYVIFYSNGFKYSERIQAEDRCHRIGQKKKVTYIDIECSYSIDERISDALSKKMGVVKQFKQEIDKVKHSRKGVRGLIERL